MPVLLLNWLSNVKTIFFKGQWHCDPLKQASDKFCQIFPWAAARENKPYVVYNLHFIEKISKNNKLDMEKQLRFKEIENLSHVHS